MSRIIVGREFFKLEFSSQEQETGGGELLWSSVVCCCACLAPPSRTFTGSSPRRQIFIFDAALSFRLFQALVLQFFFCGCSVATLFVEGGTEVGWGLCLFCLVETVWNASLLVVAFPTKAWLKRKSSNSILNVDARSLDCITHTQPVGKLHVRGAASRKAHI